MLGVLERCLGGRGFLSPTSFSRVQCCLQYESVRNYAKPRWVPIAKSKMFKMRPIPAPPKLETEELEKLNSEYELYNRSLWRFEANITMEREIQMQKEARQVSEEVELERIIEMNDKENERIRKIREEALKEEHEMVKEEILKMRNQKEDEELKELEQTEAFMKSELERLKTAIKLEDLDTVIEKALAVEHDYNFAVNKSGAFLIGRENDKETVDGPTPDKPVIKQVDAVS